MKKLANFLFLIFLGMFPAQIQDTKLADDCYKKGDYKCAEKAYSELADKERIMKHKSKHYNNLGLVQRMLGKTDLAFKSFENAWKFDTTNLDAYINLSALHLQRGSKTKALDFANQGLNLNPENQDLMITRAKIYEELKKNTEAENDYKAAIALNPQNIVARANYAAFKKNNGKFEEALKDYNQIISEKPESLIYNSRADVYLLLKKYKEASIDVEKAIKLDPKFPLSYVTKAKIQFETGKKNEACENLNKSIATGIDKYFILELLKKCEK